MSVFREDVTKVATNIAIDVNDTLRLGCRLAAQPVFFSYQQLPRSGLLLSPSHVCRKIPRLNLKMPQQAQKQKIYEIGCKHSV